MAMPKTNVGTVLPTNYVWDIQELQSIDLDPKFKELLIRLYQNLNIMALTVNNKDTGIYQLNEFSTNQTYFPNPANNSTTPQTASTRQVLRWTYLIPNLGAVATVPHNIAITANTTFVKIYGVANDTAGKRYYPLPWASAAGLTNIEVVVNATNIVITNNSGLTFAIAYIVLEYLQS